MLQFLSVRSSILSLGVFALVTSLGTGCSRTAAPAEEKKPAPVKWEAPRQVVLEEWIELVGATQPLPDHAARLTAPVGGVVVSVLPARMPGPGVDVALGSVGVVARSFLPNDGKQAIAEGQMVRQGEILAQLDATAIEASLEKAQAAKKVLQADREVAEFAVKQASLELKSLQELAKGKLPNELQLVSPVMLEKAGLALESAKASLRANDRKLEAADKEESAFEKEIQLFTLKAPRAGRLGRLQIVIGQTLPLGAPVAELVDIEEEIDVLSFVPASEARKLQLNQPAQVGGLDPKAAPVGANPEGKVVYIADQAETETGLFAVKVRFPNKDLKLRASSVARVRIKTKNPEMACWAIPESSLLEDQDPPWVVVVEDVVTKKNAEGKEEQIGKARRVRAQIGMRDRVTRQVEVLQLDEPGKKWHADLEHVLIIIEKGESLQTGDLVKLEEEEEEEEMPKPEEKP